VRERAEDDVDYERAKLGDTAKCFEDYESAHESGRHLEEARKRRAQLERWEKAKLNPRQAVIEPHSALVSLDGRRIAAIYRDGTLAFWDAQAGQLRQRIARVVPKTILDDARAQIQLSYTANSRWVVVEYRTGDQSVPKLFSAEDGAAQRTFDSYTYMGSARDGRYLLLIASQGAQAAWDTQERKFVNRSLSESLHRESDDLREPVVAANVRSDTVELSGGSSDYDCRGSALPALFTLLEKDWLVEDNTGLYTGSTDIHQHLGLTEDEAAGVAPGSGLGKTPSVPDEYKRRYYRPKGLDLAVRAQTKSGRR